MQSRDVRAVENPITAIFDLAEDVERQAGTMRRLLTYTRVFLYLFLALDFFLILFVSVGSAPPGLGAVTALVALFLTLGLYLLLLFRSAIADATARTILLLASVGLGAFLVLIFRGGLILGAVFVSLFFLGMVILDLVRSARSFFDYYALRYRVVRAVREADPVVLVPQGATPVDRLLALLGQRSEAVAGMLAQPQNVRKPAIVTGRSGVAYQFDALLMWPSGTLAPFGIGPGGGAVFVKGFERAPTRMDLEALRRAVEDVSPAIRLPPSRVIALWKSEGTAEIPEETYAFLTNEVVHASVGGRTRACSMELVTEMPDGTYDFIPLIVEAAGPAAPSPTSAPRAA